MIELGPSTNPYSTMLSTFDPARFFGRRTDLGAILQGVSMSSPRSFVLHGSKTIGKSTLLSYLCHPEGAARELAAYLGQYGPGHSGRLAFLKVDFYGVNGDAALRLLYQKLLAASVTRVAAESQIRTDPGALTRTEVKAALRDTLAVLAGEELRLVIVMDHFDHAFETMEFEDDLFLRDLTKYQAFVLATERSLDELRQDSRRSSPLVTVLSPRLLGLLSEGDARELVAAPAGVAHVPFSPVQVDFLLWAAGRQPYLLSLAGEFLYELLQQQPDLAVLLANEDVRQRVILQLETQPAVGELLAYFWGQLTAQERAALTQLARGEPADAARMALNGLRQKALIYDDLVTGKIYLFAGLWQAFVAQQRRPVNETGAETLLRDRELSPLDKKLWAYLIAHPDRICPFEELKREVWGNPEASQRGLEAAVHRLRIRLKTLGLTDWAYLENVRGQGYQFTPRPD